MYSYIVIDDEINIRKGLIKKINDIPDNNYVCIGEAENGIKGIELLKDKKPDIVITDMKMNKMDGVQFLNEIQKFNMKQPVIVISSFKDFEYMHKAIESGVIGYVLKPFSSEEIEQQLKKAVTELENRGQIESFEKKIQLWKLEENFKGLQDWILGNPDIQMTDIKIELDCCFRLISINFKNVELYETCFSICQEICDSTKWAVMKNVFLKSQILVLLYTNKEKGKYLKLKAEQFYTALKNRFTGEKIICVISREKEGISELSTLRKENDKMLRELYIGNTCGILYTEQQNNYCMIYSQECMDSWIGQMKYETIKVSSIMTSFFHNIDRKQFKLGDIQKTCEYLVNRINEWAKENSIESDNIMRFFDTRYIFDDDLERMEREIKGYITLIVHSIPGIENEKDDLFIKIDNYIRKNYNKKLTLSMIADSAYVSQSVCRNMLKERGISVNDYLTKIRVESAKRLLKEMSISIEHISKEIGYKNPKYFFKIFKKETGLTPQEYRKREKNK